MNVLFIHLQYILSCFLNLGIIETVISVTIKTQLAYSQRAPALTSDWPMNVRCSILALLLSYSTSGNFYYLVKVMTHLFGTI